MRLFLQEEKYPEVETSIETLKIMLRVKLHMLKFSLPFIIIDCISKMLQLN